MLRPLLYAGTVFIFQVVVRGVVLLLVGIIHTRRSSVTLQESEVSVLVSRSYRIS